MRRHCLGWLFTTGLLAASVSLPAQVRTPDIRVDEVGFGEAWLRATRSQLNERVDPFCLDLLETWLTRLRNYLDIGTLPLTPLCLNSSGFNAFAAPGGIVAMNRGVYQALATEAEVMAVLAHELAHLALRHHVRGLRQQEGVTPARLAMLAGLFAAIATEQGTAAQSLIMGGQAAELQNQLAYSREYEREADRLGVVALSGAGYRPEAMVAVLKYLADQQTRGRTDLAFLSTHPLGIERQSELEGRIAQLPTQGRDEAILSATGFDVYRCLQTEGMDTPLLRSRLDCSEVWNVLTAFRAKKYEDALALWNAQPIALRQTLPGLDLTLALALATRKEALVQSVLDELGLYYPEWVMLDIAALEVASWQETPTVPRSFRAMLIERPDRLDAWRALARFAETTGQAHLLHEARAWDLLLHGQIKAGQDQWKDAKRTWPAELEARPLERLESRIKLLL